MENASKALMMAGGVLISLIVIAVAVIAYQKFIEVQNYEQSATRTEQSADFNKSFEAFNRDKVYGSEILSLANKVVDYNKLQAEDKGYSRITLQVKIKNATGTYFKATTYTDVDDGDRTKGLIYQNNLLETEINKYTKKQYKGKSVSYYARTTLNEIAQIFNISYQASISYDLEDKLRNSSSTRQLMKDIDLYNGLVAEQLEMKRKSFQCTKIEYDKKTGRVSKMIYEEK